MSEPERFLVTGCAGFIGSHIVRRLLDDGLSVIGVDNLSTGRMANLDGLKGKFDFLKGDLTNAVVAERSVRGVTHVLHQASIPSVPRSLREPLASLHASATATVTLLDAARKAGVKRFVQAGSSSAYGDSDVLPKHEELLPRPLSPYAAAKLAQEHYATAFYHSHGLDTVTLRYFNVFGPRQDPTSEYAAVIPKFITLMLEGRAPTIYGDGEQTRDFTYVDNVVHGNLLAARHPEPLRGEVYNLALGERVSLNRLVAELNRLLAIDVKPVYEPARAGDVRHSQADVRKVTERMGFKPTVSFEEGLERAIAWLKAEAAGRR